MATLGLILLLFFFLAWGFSPLRAFFPYLLIPLFMIGFSIGFLFIGTVSTMPSF